MENYAVSSIVVAALTGFVLYKRYPTVLLGWFRDKWNKVKLIKSLVDNIDNEEKVVEGRITQINEGDKSMTIVYNYFGVEYVVSVPFRRDYVAAMAGYKASVRKNGVWTDITQQPGVPYLVSTDQLGASEMLITNTDTGASVNPHPEWVPNYVTHLME